MSDKKNNFRKGTNKSTEEGPTVIGSKVGNGADVNKAAASGNKANARKQQAKRNRNATVASIFCFVAAIAIVGTYTFRDYRNVKQQEAKLAQAQQEVEKAKEQLAILEADGEAGKEGASGQKNQLEFGDGSRENSQGEPQNAQTESPNGSEAAGGADGTADGANTAQDHGAAAGQAAETAGNAVAASAFSSESSLLWPIDGTVIMSYSMDKTVYFKTLDQYRYNPAMVISGAEGDQVICGAPGVVKSIDQNVKNGITVDVDLGGGYEVLYGQLKDVPVKVGDHVEAKSILGYVNQPTKYYSEEGCNIYLEMRKDGRPVNPMDYLAEE